MPGHACAIRMADGTGILVHIGIDTVHMNGKEFEQLKINGIMLMLDNSLW